MSDGIDEAFDNTCQRWRLSSAQQGVLKDHALDVFGISVALGGLFDESSDAEYQWVHAARDKFDGHSALYLMLYGHFDEVKALVDDERNL
jgi:hypothetical protein